MSRAAQIMNDLELAAHKLGISIEDAILILIGKHPTHGVVQVHAAETPPATPPATGGNAAPAAEIQSSGSSTEPEQTASSAGNASADNDTPGAAA